MSQKNEITLQSDFFENAKTIISKKYREREDKGQQNVSLNKSHISFLIYSLR